MQTYLEKLLEEKCKGTACSVLYTQWMLAKDYIPKVQSVIVRTFPHYSLHDASHSESILNCITRVLGVDSMNSLSSVDLWLLLSAAYYHDYGMAVFSRDIEDILKEADFFQFVKDCQADEDSPLHPFAQIFDVRDDGIYFKEVALSGDTYDGARFLLADFVRRKHAQRSKEALDDDSSIHLPGDPIPNRLIHLLGSICEAHTQSFSQVMALPKTELGLGLDDCHPRFVAAMLRIGDLLDLDNNRFSTVLIKTLPVIPKDSLLHKKKHLSIEHLRIDDERVEVWARCKDYEVADITNLWLEMVAQEFHLQKDVWQEIIPSGFTGHLPSVGELKVDLEGYDTIDGKKRPGFEIDASKAIELLQGAGMYTNPAQCIRELLQNSVDAIYLALFQEHPEELDTVEKFLEACKEKHVRLDINKTGIDGANVVWRVRIEDQGLGMNQKDIQYLIKTGSKNIEKMHLIEKMPEYMRPSGTFGIGFQSVFLMTDKVSVRTRKINTSRELTIELYNPAGPRKGAVLIKTNDAPSSAGYGTVLEFDFKSDKNLNRWSVSSGELFAQYTVYSYDFVSDKTMDLDTARVLDEVLSFSRACPVTLDVKLNGNNLDWKKDDSRAFDYYSASQGLQLTIHEGKPNRYVDLFYRNQVVQKPGISIPFLSVSVNILAGNAKDLLTLNRNELRYQAQADVHNRIVAAIGEMLKDALYTLPDTVKAQASMFLHQFFASELHEYPDLKDAWKDFVYKGNDYFGSDPIVWPCSFGELVEKSKGKTVVWQTVEVESHTGVEWHDDMVVVKNLGFYNDIFAFLLRMIDNEHPYPCNGIAEEFVFNRAFCLSCVRVDPIKDWVSWVKNYKSSANYGRTLMPCNSEFGDLELRKGTSFLFAYDSTFPVNDYPLMICPYVRVMEADAWHPRTIGLEWNDAEGELYKMTYENRAHQEVTMEQIKASYKRLRDVMDKAISSAFSVKEA